jgi:hypothetical protein
VYSRTRSSKYLEDQRRKGVDENIPDEGRTNDPADKVEYIYMNQT